MGSYLNLNYWNLNIKNSLLQSWSHILSAHWPWVATHYFSCLDYRTLSSLQKLFLDSPGLEKKTAIQIDNKRLLG